MTSSESEPAELGKTAYADHMGEDFESVLTRWQTLQREAKVSDPAVAADRIRANHAQLLAQDLSSGEAALIAVIRQGPSRESRLLALELVDALLPAAKSTDPVRVAAAVCCALLAGAAVKLPTVLAEPLSANVGSFYLRNAALLVLPFIAAYFAKSMRLAKSWWLLLGIGFAAGAALSNLLPWQAGGDAELLLSLHLPVLLFVLLSLAMLNVEWREVEARLRLVRFAIEWFVLTALVALGGVVLTGLLAALLSQVGLGSEPVWEWVVLIGVGGAAVLTAVLASAQARFVAGATTILARLFVPLFALMLAVFFGLVLATGRLEVFDRNLLFTFDAVLVIVTALSLYISATRSPLLPRGWLDWALAALVLVAICVDVFALGSTLTRIWDLGWSANRAAAVGLNIVLLGNLVGTGVMLTRLQSTGQGFDRVHKWQARYLPVYFAWAAVVCFAFPAVFGLD